MPCEREGRCLLGEGEGENGHLDDTHGAGDGNGINHSNRVSICVMVWSCPFWSVGCPQVFHNSESLAYASKTSKPHLRISIMANFSHGGGSGGACLFWHFGFYFERFSYIIPFRFNS